MVSNCRDLTKEISFFEILPSFVHSLLEIYLKNGTKKTKSSSCLPVQIADSFTKPLRLEFCIKQLLDGTQHRPRRILKMNTILLQTNYPNNNRRREKTPLKTPTNNQILCFLPLNNADILYKFWITWLILSTSLEVQTEFRMSGLKA